MIKESLILFLMIFASNNSGYQLPVDNSLPTIEFKSNIENVIPEPCGEKTWGYTNMRTGIITLPSNFNQNDQDDICGLAHELTHYLQSVNHQIYGNVELKAYHVEAMCYKKLFKSKDGHEWAKSEIEKHKKCE